MPSNGIPSDLNFDVELPAAKILDGEDEVTVKKVGLFDTELVEEFFTAFVREGGVTLELPCRTLTANFYRILPLRVPLFFQANL
mgnify:CR=1 FL=1